jgi:hypothetical protein
VVLKCSVTYQTNGNGSSLELMTGPRTKGVGGQTSVREKRSEGRMEVSKLKREK